MITEIIKEITEIKERSLITVIVFKNLCNQ